MDVLDSVLRAAKAEKYLQSFRNFEVDPGTLPLLSDEDLKLIGIEEEEIRETIINQSKTLQIPSETKLDLTITKDYVNQTLHNIQTQLNRHIANLSCALQRKDVINVDINTTVGVNVLGESLKSLERQVDFLKRKTGTKKNKPKKKKIIGLMIVASALATLLIGIQCLKNR